MNTIKSQNRDHWPYGKKVVNCRHNSWNFKVDFDCNGHVCHGGEKFYDTFFLICTSLKQCEDINWYPSLNNTSY